MNDLSTSPAFWPVIITLGLIAFAVAIGGLALILWMFTAKPNVDNTKAKIQANIAEAMTAAEAAKLNIAAGKRAEALLAEVAPELAKAPKQ